VNPSLNEIVLAYKMAGDRVLVSSDSSITKICNILNLSIDYAELMKFNSEININDIEVWRALCMRYMKQL